ncbi:hypothetical protein OG393_32725 (plasmid) [Streptomyces sp. NBC_01216]|uniref:hypothetical protein n=1 Tax=Streptomyces sp. NBC_01216 TaxID=2903778 RepID=UPI002E1344B1|nr:hypothetical protein OG393_32725 [Streptomyces sp. NBC_01216]
MPSPVMPETDANSLLGLLRSAPFSAPYLGEIIDWIRRSVHQEAEEGRGSYDVDAEALRRLDAYATGLGPGAAELGRRLSDARHALEAVQHDHYLRLAVGQGADGSTARVSRRSELLKLATAVGSSRVAAGPTGAIVITSAGSGSTVFRPVDPEVAHQLRGAARERKEATVRRAAAVRDLLAQHVRMVDWSDPQAVGVVVESSDTTVTMSWWESHVAVGPSLWVEGGVRLLCAALLADRGYAVAMAGDGALHVTA